MDATRRNVLAAAPALGLAAVLAGCMSRSGGLAAPGGLYRVDDEATILAAARAIIAEDPVAALITLDAHGVPRVRSVGVSTPGDDLTMWMGTRPTSRKVAQIRANPTATLYFNDDDLDGNFESACYASFMGTASVHVDEATLALHGPDEATRRAFWPDFPRDYAAIRFQPRWLEVAGRGIAASAESWQPQAVVLER